MTEQTNSEAQGSSLIENYKQAAAKQRLAGRCITLLTILTVLGFVFLIWSEIVKFQKESIPKFTEALEQEATEYLPTVSQNAREMAGRLAPVYVESFKTILERDEDAYHKTLMQEFALLEAHAQQKSWPEIEKALATLVAEQEMALSTGLDGILDRDQLQELSIAYRFALQNYMKDFYAEEFAHHDALGAEIITKLHIIAEQETEDIPSDTRYLVGMLIELLGLQLQDAAVTQTASN